MFQFFHSDQALSLSSFTYPDKLIAAERKLMYFQPPSNYKIPSAYSLISEQWIEIYGELPSSE